MKKMITLLFIMLLSLTSCSRLDIAVNLANSYITNKTDDYFDLTRDQKNWLKAALDRNIDKVKKTILPQLAAELHKASNTIAAQTIHDANAVYLTYQRVENLMFQALRIFASDAGAFSEKLTSQQMVTFQHEFDKKLKEYKDDPEKKSYDKMKKQFDSWLGSVTSDQKKKLKSFVAENPPPVKEALFNRQNLAHNFIRVYPDLSARRKYVEKLFTQYDIMREPGYTKLITEKNKKVAGFVTSILNSMTDDQRSSLVTTLRDRANQLIKISKG